jgi:uncharacterized protein (TIGR02145 family)
VQVPPAQGDSITSLNSTKCGLMTTFTGTNTGAVIAMLDSSDGTNKYYAVAKLADNRCWMISNYARAYGTKVDVVNNGTWTTSTGLTTSFYADPAVATPISGTRACTGAGYATTAANAIAYLADSGNTAANSIRNCGYLYNWLGATAGAGVSGLANTIVTSSICPAGWHLPSNGGVGTSPTGWANTTELSTMYSNIGGTAANLKGSSSPWRGVYMGATSVGSSVSSQGLSSYVWSSSAYVDTTYNYAYGLFFYSTTTVRASDYNYKYSSEAVRCVLNV